MKTILAEYDRMLRSYTADSQHIWLIAIHQIVTSGRKVIMLLPYSRARKLMSGILYVMIHWTASLLTTHPQT